MDVTDILRDRMQGPGGLSRMVALSLVVHAVAVTVMLFAQAGWLGRTAEKPTNVMTISIGGAGEGPLNGGMTPAAPRAVQVETPPEEIPKRDTGRPPAAKTPEMVIPTTKASARPSKATPEPAVKSAPDDARGRTPTKGAKTADGNALANTQVRGLGFGLSTGGGPGSGSKLDVEDFCCPEYIVTMVDRIRSAWQQKQGATGVVVVKFTILRDGQLAQYVVEQSSGLMVLDQAALRAVVGTKTLNPLPSQFPNQTLGVHLNFEYK
jgi:TonB family protein